jgi:hypothetical protein
MAKKSLAELSSDDILASILDPEGSPLPAKYEQEKRRVIQAAQLWDSYPNERQVSRMLQIKYNISLKTAYRDIALSKQLFKSEHTFDWDATMAWMIKDQIELINKCKVHGDYKEWNNAKKVLRQIIGDRPAKEDDPQRMQANMFVIQVNNNGHVFNLSLDKVRKLAPDELKTMIDAMSDPITDADAEEIFDS